MSNNVNVVKADVQQPATTQQSKGNSQQQSAQNSGKPEEVADQASPQSNEGNPSESAPSQEDQVKPEFDPIVLNKGEKDEHLD